MRRFSVTRAASLVLLLLSACATGHDSIEMEPMMVRGRTDATLGLDGYDAQGLLSLAWASQQEGRHGESALILRRLLETFPEASVADTARFRLGQNLEAVHDLPGAFFAYQEVPAESSDYVKAQFRLAHVGAQLERWPAVADAFWRAAQAEDLSPMLRIEAGAGMGVAFFMSGEFASSESAFLKMLAYHQKQSEKIFLPAKYFVGQARFYLGEIIARRFEGMSLRVEQADADAWVDMLGNALEKKCATLLRAQSAFIHSIRAGHPGWATAAGYRIGSMYERLYDEVLALPVAKSLGEEGAAIYRDELTHRVRVLISKAIEVYERSLSMAARVGEKNEWVDRAQAALERLRALYLKGGERGSSASAPPPAPSAP